MPQQRKREVLGLILMAVALLLGLALATYTPQDNPGVREASLSDLLMGLDVGAANALGSIGAALAYLLIPNFLGYTTLLFTVLLGAWGYVTFRGRHALYLPLVTVLTLVGAFVLASLFGWLALTLGADLHLWSGAAGEGTAAWMQRVFGTVGSLILLLLLLAVTVMLVIDHDIQRSIDRVEAAFHKVVRVVSQWWDRQRTRHAERRAERLRLREERQRQREEEHARQEEERVHQAREAASMASASGEQHPSTRRPPVPAPPPAAMEATEAPAGRPPPTEYQTVNDLYRSSPPPTREEEPPAAPAASPEVLPAQEPAPARATNKDIELKVQGPIKEEKTDTIEHQVDEVPEEVPYTFPGIDLLDAADEDDPLIDFEELEQNKAVLLDKLDTYNIEITDVNAIVGPTVTRYELTPAPGVKISRITAREDDLAMAMAAQGIRMIAPIPGKSAVGVEIPNRHRELVRLRDVIGTAKFNEAKMELPIALGKTIEGEVFIRDLTKMPHLLIAGATGSGKSVGLNALILGLLFACHPANLKFVVIDPKKIELQQYEKMLDHYMATFPDTEDAIITNFEEALGVLKSCEKEMERRYDLLSDASVRGIKDYNRKFREGQLDPEEGHRYLPYIVVVVDELADLMMTAGKDIEAPIARLAQMARAVGIHLILATQRPSVDVITGLIKANFPARIAFQVASRVDSRTILDQIGAEGLVGNGDLLYQSGSQLVRLQGPFVSIDEVDRIMDFIADQPGPGPYELPELQDSSDLDLEDVLASTDRDDLFEQAARLIVRAQQGSVSLLQRKLSVGYTRAARIVDQLEDAGIVGPFEGSKARQVLVADEEELERTFEADREAQQDE